MSAFFLLQFLVIKPSHLDTYYLDPDSLKMLDRIRIHNTVLGYIVL
jgi:hypothetical protein